MNMRELARRLVAAEHRPGDSPDSESRAAFRVCERLRESLSLLAGIRGFRTLLARALTLAKVEAPVLATVEVKADGSLIIPDALARDAGPAEAATAATALVAHLLQLLATFIGEALTLRLVHQVWPSTAHDNPETGGRT